MSSLYKNRIEKYLFLAEKNHAQYQERTFKKEKKIKSISKEKKYFRREEKRRRYIT